MGSTRDHMLAINAIKANFDGAFRFSNCPMIALSQNPFVRCHLITSLSYLPFKECCAMDLKLMPPISKSLIRLHLLLNGRRHWSFAAAIANTMRSRLFGVIY